MPSPRQLAQAALATSLVLLAAARPATAQSVLADMYREQADVQAYNANAQQYQLDLMTGNPLGALGDMLRMNQAAQQFNVDQQRLANDVSAMQSPPPLQPTVIYAQPPEQLVPHPTLANRFYYPSNPGQLYFIPGNDPAPPVTTTPVATRSTPSVPINQRPVVRFKVRINNPATTGVAIRYAIDGRELMIESGESTDLDVTEGSVITFNRGEGLGDARYGLGRGIYDFAFTEAGWEVYNKPFPSFGNTARANPTPSSRANPRPNQGGGVPPDPRPYNGASN